MSLQSFRRDRLARQGLSRHHNTWNAPGYYVPSRGKVKLSVVPAPGALDARISPPCAVTSPRAMVSPRPDPLDPDPLWNRSNARAISSADIPLPVSRTSTVTASPLPLERDSYT